jgi:hypothetical protein
MVNRVDLLVLLTEKEKSTPIQIQSIKVFKQEIVFSLDFQNTP